MLLDREVLAPMADFELTLYTRERKNGLGVLVVDIEFNVRVRGNIRERAVVEYVARLADGTLVVGVGYDGRSRKSDLGKKEIDY